MNLQRISVKLFASNPQDVNLPAVTPVFHRWIQQAAVPGILIDVADYEHMIDGPGILLVGHDCDYAMDLERGMPGMLYVGKYLDEGAPLSEALPEALSRVVAACQAFEQDGSVNVTFDTSKVEIMLRDRLRAPNNAETYAAVKDDVQAAVSAVFGDAVSLSRDEHARRCVTITASASSSPALSELATKAGAGA